MIVASLAQQDQWSESVQNQLFILDAVKLSVIQQQFWMKECDILRAETYSDPS